MDHNLVDNESLIARIKQLEHERDQLHKDIEQLCMQQAGPAYLGVATRMHFQRTAGLEQEIENLKKKLATCTRENQNLQEELSEAYNIKSQLADLHSTEVSKNIEAEKQLKFFQGCVAAAFAERDNAIMEAEKSREKEELISQELNKLDRRIQELTSELSEEKSLTTTLRIDLGNQERRNETFKEVINKFYDIRQRCIKNFADTSWEDKCESLLHDSPEMWSFQSDNEPSTSNYISDLEAEVKTLSNCMDNLQNKLQLGLEIETHLKKKVSELEKKKILSEKKIKKEISALHYYHSQCRNNITNLLDEGYSEIKSIIDVVEEKTRQREMSEEQNLKSSPLEDVKLQENELRDDTITGSGQDSITKRSDPGFSPTITMGTGDTSEALSQALQEKVAALLLMSQQEERHLLESNVNASLQKKVEELQRNLLQVTNEKVKALLELAELKQEHHMLQERISQDMKKGKHLVETEEGRTIQEKDGRIKNLLKRTYLRNWVVGYDGNHAEAHVNHEGNFTDRKSNYNMDFARMKIENATLRESLDSMEHLTTSVHRLRISLLKVKESASADGTNISLLEALDQIVSEAKLIKTALGSSLPISWSGETDKSYGDSPEEDVDNAVTKPSSQKVDFVSAAGFEMVELLIFAAQELKDVISNKDQRNGD
ncbi:myosin heavy chain, cardiac muscle isoform isoform X1 [Olea europaea var. sylvestris]|uniref:myosin heavy chain, cardiac muscle isoform isoform X1 n=2 Tax=Olea europaea var. sylvestris TaxID=158386 RepID=UPI000C1D5D66|nr:myosin heavy chain, cardiac muscle isoform isoform X1 [Olea europaea var. sylvestris]XP_022896873.1 myosin heavy chain, cardiac muscle isoform isoform X1 [Olea europaea var. sylvestris]